MTIPELPAPQAPRPNRKRGSRPDGPVFLRHLWETSHALRAMSGRMERHIGISGPQRLVLREVGAAPGITPGRLAEVLAIHPSTVTGLVDRLVDRGLIERERRSDDRRSSRLTLTPPGGVLLAAPGITIEDVVERTLATLPSATKREAARFLEAVSRALREAADEPGCEPDVDAGDVG